LTQNIGTNYTVTIPALSDDASIVEAFKYYHTGGLTGSVLPNSLEYHITSLNTSTSAIQTTLGYTGVSPTPASVHARLSSLESTVGTSLSSTYIKAIPSSNDTPATRNLIQPSTTSVVPLILQGVVGQTADLQQWKTSAGTVARVTSAGAVFSYDGSSMAEVATLSGTQTLTNKTLSTPIQTIVTYVRTSSYTLALSDQSKMIEMNSSSATLLTVPTDAAVNFPIGTYVVVLRTGSGAVSVDAQAGVTINFTPGLNLRAQWSMATLIKRSANTWVLSGDTI
jgi:hypothetical protein